MWHCQTAEHISALFLYVKLGNFNVAPSTHAHKASIAATPGEVRKFQLAALGKTAHTLDLSPNKRIIKVATTTHFRK